VEGKAALVAGPAGPSWEGVNRCCGSFYRRNQPVAPAMDGFNERGLLCVISENVSELGNRPGENVLGDELGGPHGVDELLALDELTGVLGEAHQHVHHLELDLYGLAVARQAVEARFHEPIAEAERPFTSGTRIDFEDHVEINVAHGTENDKKGPREERGRRKE